MTETTITEYIRNTLVGVDITVDSGNSFFFYNPGGDLPADHKFPFATLVTNDQYDSVSNLNRAGVYRLNIGVSKETFRKLFPAPAGDATHDFTALDRIMPHPVYGMMYWICVLSPSDATFESVKPLLTEAYQVAAKRHPKSKPA